MTSYTDRGVKPERGEILAFDHVHFWVGNAFQAAAYYISRFGFEPFVYRGLETGSRSVMTQVVKQNAIIFAFSSAIEPGSHEIANHVLKHGDGVKDVAFRVDDCAAVYERAIAAGAVSVSKPQTHVTEQGTCVLATVEAPYEGTCHTFVERKDYNGNFLPGYAKIEEPDPQLDLVEPVNLRFIDHCVANQPEGEMDRVAQWYVEKFAFHRFWSVDDKQLHTKYSSLRSVVVADYFERVKMPINEPANGLRKSQIQEFVDYYGGPGIQHIALNTSDIVTSVSRLRQRGVAFIQVPDTYYTDLKNRLSDSSTNVTEGLNKLKAMGILVDFDESGYLLQIFTKPTQDRPTFFLEIIQRRSHEGFGAGNFKSLFEAIEREQALRGNL
ncbi:4-hydroxyphenylpyruvate dioxygenase, 4HPPD [Chondrus crispus]|uniref:4-hydroxyphenylpyruvate dioxygenase n=1 Tax=Chondrus crispus TaxID=2769 RepID=R7QFK1_CHOCR|nr:4-hydroxyphenylpyruvate dioxygenase, 4HPPD [Chondrus crispus]CDF36200.1 4-hydroxyphenylpyruvate dioxygenase, 4HPPD [Chondrus crispus]|eukprot:XP_005716019.1 4-hydroxyphenylpyruvate dioxygenase, 4HPPD [Chondrus crispus]